RVTARGAQLIFASGNTLGIEGGFDVKWPALKNGALKLGTVASIEFEISDIAKTGGWAALSESLRIARGHFDLSTLLAGLGGSIDSGPLEMAWVKPYSADGNGTLRVTGMQVNGIAVENWVPLLPAPEWKLSGPLL